jgi:hypothetical protein
VKPSEYESFGTSRSHPHFISPTTTTSSSSSITQSTIIA